MQASLPSLDDIKPDTPLRLSPTKKLIEPPTEKQIAAWPKEWQNDHWSTLGVDTFVEVHGRSPGTPPEYDDCVTELDTWAASPEGQRELKRRGIKPWW